MSVVVIRRGGRLDWGDGFGRLGWDGGGVAVFSAARAVLREGTSVLGGGLSGYLGRCAEGKGKKKNVVPYFLGVKCDLFWVSLNLI